MTWVNKVFAKSCESMKEIPDESVHCCVTSPPYWGLRDYGNPEQIGIERTPAEYVDRMVGVFAEVYRVLRPDGTLWLNIGDSYCGSGRGGNPEDSPYHNVVKKHGGYEYGQKGNAKPIIPAGLKAKDLVGIPWMVAFALRADGWYLRSDIIWHKNPCMPSSVTDRCTSSHEYVFMLAKSRRYFYDADAIRDPLAESTVERMAQDVDSQAGSTRQPGKTNGPMKAVVFGGKRAAEYGSRQYSGNAYVADTKGANKRDVWTIAPAGYDGAHFAVMPRELARLCILAGSPKDGIVLDPFMGSGTVADVAIGCGRRYVGYELNAEYHKLIQDRLGLFGESA